MFLKKQFAAYRNQYVNFIKVTSEPFQACYFWGHLLQGELQKIGSYYCRICPKEGKAFI